MSFSESYVGGLRQIVGSRLLHVPGARIVIENSEGLILLQLRSDFGLWGLPGGSAEKNESMIDVIAREIEEETGLTIGQVQAFAHASDPRFECISFPNGDRCHFHVVNFHTTEFTGTLRGDHERLELGWFAPSRHPGMLPNMRRSVEAFLRFRDTGRFQLI